MVLDEFKVVKKMLRNIILSNLFKLNRKGTEYVGFLVPMDTYQ